VGRTVEQVGHPIEIVRHQVAVRPGGDGDHVASVVVDEDEADARVAAGLQDPGPQQALSIEQLECGVGERIATQLHDERHVCTEAPGPDGLVRSLASRAHVERVAQDGLAGGRQRRGNHGQADVVAADHHDPAHQRRSVCRQWA
jgi:hypothetical protein